MKRVQIFGAAAGFCLLIAGATAHAAQKIVWVKSFDAAMAQAKKSHKMVIVDFYTDWCHGCKLLDEKTYPDALVSKAVQQLIAVKVNGEKEGVKVVKKYHIEGYPTIQFIAPDGTAAGKIEGFVPPKPFLDSMQKFLATRRELPGLEAKAARSTAGAATLAKLTLTYAVINEKQKTEKALAKLEKTDLTKADANLAKAYNATGDMYQGAQYYEKAIPLFQKALKVSKTPYDTAYAYIGSAVCRFSIGELKAAIPDLKALLALPKAPADLKQKAQQMLNVATRPGR